MQRGRDRRGAKGGADFALLVPPTKVDEVKEIARSTGFHASEVSLHLPQRSSPGWYSISMHDVMGRDETLDAICGQNLRLVQKKKGTASRSTRSCWPILLP